MYQIRVKCIKDIDFYNLNKGIVCPGVVSLLERGTVIEIIIPGDISPITCSWDWFIEYFELIA